MQIPVPSVPQYETTLPVSKKKIKFRPFLVKEEKILLLAAEADEQSDREYVDAIIQVLTNCTLDKVEVSKLATADVEWLFIQIRKRSVGEIISGTVKCPHCSAVNLYEINLDKVAVLGGTLDRNIKLDDTFMVTMKFPTVGGVNSLSPSYKATDRTMATIASMVEMIVIGDNVLSDADMSIADIMAWLENLTTTQVEEMEKFIADLPRVTYDDSIKCVSCSGEVKIHMEGLESFFL